MYGQQANLAGSLGGTFTAYTTPRPPPPLTHVVVIVHQQQCLRRHHGSSGSNRHVNLTLRPVNIHTMELPGEDVRRTAAAAALVVHKMLPGSLNCQASSLCCCMYQCWVPGPKPVCQTTAMSIDHIAMKSPHRGLSGAEPGPTSSQAIIGYCYCCATGPSDWSLPSCQGDSSALELLGSRQRLPERSTVYSSRSGQGPPQHAMLPYQFLTSVAANPV